MPANIETALANDLPVLFAYIGWTEKYNGSEPVVGGFAYIKRHPSDNSEVRAFAKENDGFFHCGMGRGQAAGPIHVVFLAAEPRTQTKKLVGVYASGLVKIQKSGWAEVRTREAALIPVRARPTLSVAWPGRQGIRRWARRISGPSHPDLLREFEGLRSHLSLLLKTQGPVRTDLDQMLVGIEGKQRKRLILERNRELKLRNAKIAQVLSSKRSRLVCEVPRCGFDFLAQYGELGRGYAHVHHRTALAAASTRGRRVTLDDLAIVCANCHAMIHRNGECRALKNLIPKKKQ
jgi:hypothetical protein